MPCRGQWQVGEVEAAPGLRLSPEPWQGWWGGAFLAAAPCSLGPDRTARATSSLQNPQLCRKLFLALVIPQCHHPAVPREATALLQPTEGLPAPQAAAPGPAQAAPLHGIYVRAAPKAASSAHDSWVRARMRPTSWEAGRAAEPRRKRGERVALWRPGWGEGGGREELGTRGTSASKGKARAGSPGPAGWVWTVLLAGGG